MKKIYILTLFPEYFTAFFKQGIVSKMFNGERGNFEYNFIDIAQFTPKSFKGVDDAPFGGGAGVVMRADVLESALLSIASEKLLKEKYHVVFPCPRGKVWTTKRARIFTNKYLAQETDKDLIFICGRYEGVDERFLENYVNEYISLGDFILTGGELAVQVILDSTLRLLPESLNNSDSAQLESFENNLLEHPHYTRPQELNGQKVPRELLSGNHRLIKEYRQQESVKMTQKHRPDLLKREKND